MDLLELIESQLKAQVEELGIELNVSLDEARNFVAGRMAVLTSFTGTDEFTAATISERDTAAIYLARNLVDRADDADGRFLSFLQGMLAFGAQSLTTDGGAE